MSSGNQCEPFRGAALAEVVAPYIRPFNKPLSTGKNKKVTGLMKDELGGEIIAEFGLLRPKAYSYFLDDRKSDKKPNRTKNW